MNLISCPSCGIVLDKDHLKFLDWIYDGEDFIAITSCPVCKKPIQENGEN